MAFVVRLGEHIPSASYVFATRRSWSHHFAVVRTLSVTETAVFAGELSLPSSRRTCQSVFYLVFLQVMRSQANQPFHLEWMDPPLSDVPASAAFLGPADGSNHVVDAVLDEGEGDRYANGDYEGTGNGDGTQRIDEEGAPGSYSATPDDSGNQQSHGSGAKPMLGTAGSREGAKSFEGGAHHHDTEVDYDFE